MTKPKLSQIVDIGVDYLTVTGTTKQSKQRVWNFGHRVVRSEKQQGNEQRLWKWKEYEGFKCGSVQVGTRDDSSICRIEGGLAREHFREAYDVSTNCSRVDYQVTVKIEREPQAWILSEFKRALNWSKDLERPPAVDIHWSNNGTATAYFNKRVSELFGRIYDKGGQSKLPVLEGCVRYELECKGDQAFHQLKQLASDRAPHDLIARSLHKFFKARRCKTPWKADSTQTLVLHRPASDRIRQLEWIAKCCRPTVQRLMATGNPQEVLTCLGFDEVTLARVGKRYRDGLISRKQKEA